MNFARILTNILGWSPLYRIHEPLPKVYRQPRPVPEAVQQELPAAAEAKRKRRQERNRRLAEKQKQCDGLDVWDGRPEGATHKDQDGRFWKISGPDDGTGLFWTQQGWKTSEISSAFVAKLDALPSSQDSEV